MTSSETPLKGIKKGIAIQKYTKLIVDKPFENLRKKREDRDLSIFIKHGGVGLFSNWSNFCFFTHTRILLDIKELKIWVMIEMTS